MRLDESGTSSDEPAGTRESETACAESQPCSKKTESGMTVGDTSGSGVAGSKVTCVELQSGCVMSLATDTTLFLAGGERISLCFSCLTGGWPQYSQTMLLTLSNSSHSHSLHFPLGTPRLSFPIYPGYTKTINTYLEQYKHE